MASKSHFNDARYHGPVATRMRELMKDKNVSLAEMAEKLEKSKQAVSQYQNGTILPNLETLVKIADTLDTTTDFLLGRTDDPNVQCSIVDDTGLTADAITILKTFKHSQTQGYDLLHLINRIICSKNLVHALARTNTYLSILQAKKVQSYFYRTIVKSAEKIDDPYAEKTDNDLDQYMEELEVYKREMNRIWESEVLGSNITSALGRIFEIAGAYEVKLESVFAVEALSACGKIVQELIETSLEMVDKDLPLVMEKLEKMEE